MLALQKIGPLARPVAFLPLLKLSNDADEDIANAGFDALKQLGELTAEEIDTLIETLKQTRDAPAVRRYAVDRLGELGALAAKAVPTITTVLRSEVDDPQTLLRSMAAAPINAGSARI